MAPAAITEDYYMILEVEQTASPQLILSSYRRLALKLHPDRNGKPDATAAFQRLLQAYETLKDESKRQEYDSIYHFLRPRRSSPRDTQTCPPPAATAQPEALSEAAQIAAIRTSRQERSARWRTTKYAFDASILELQRGIRRVEQDIKNLDSILAAEAAEEAQRNSWGAWLLSPIYKQAECSEEEKARKDIKRQERRIEKALKERRLESRQADLEKEETRCRKAKELVDIADLADDEKLRTLQAKIWARENRERQEKERLEREIQAKLWREQREAAEVRRKEAEKQAEVELRRYEEFRKESFREQQEAAEARRKRTEKRLAEQQERYEKIRRSQKARDWDQYNTACLHEGWWPKVQGRTACPSCFESWTFLLQCPGCSIKMCPRCQAAIRHRMPRRVPPRMRTPNPDFDYEDHW